jgi:hypothetical protein
MQLIFAVDQVAYLVVAETLATRPDAGTLSIDAGLRGDTIVLRLDGPQAPPSQYLLDRIGASDGTLTY